MKWSQFQSLFCVQIFIYLPWAVRCWTQKMERTGLCMELPRESLQPSAELPTHVPRSQKRGSLNYVALESLGLKDGLKKSPSKCEEFTCGLSSELTTVGLVANTGNQISPVGIRKSSVDSHDLAVWLTLSFLTQSVGAMQIPNASLHLG